MTHLHGSLEILAKTTRQVSAARPNIAIKNHYKKKNTGEKKLIGGNRATTQAKITAEEMLARL